MDDKFEQFEMDIMNRIIAEDSSISYLLNKQYKSAIVSQRNFTGAGFFTDFEVTDKSLAIPDYLDLQLGKVNARIEGLAFGAGFILFIEDGLIAMLEGYTYGEPWPTPLTAYTIE